MDRIDDFNQRAVPLLEQADLIDDYHRKLAAYHQYQYTTLQEQYQAMIDRCRQEAAFANLMPEIALLEDAFYVCYHFDSASRLQDRMRSLWPCDVDMPTCLLMDLDYNEPWPCDCRLAHTCGFIPSRLSFDVDLFLERWAQRSTGTLPVTPWRRESAARPRSLLSLGYTHGRPPVGSFTSSSSGSWEGSAFSPWAPPSPTAPETPEKLRQFRSESGPPPRPSSAPRLTTAAAMCSQPVRGIWNRGSASADIVSNDAVIPGLGQAPLNTSAPESPAEIPSDEIAISEMSAESLDAPASERPAGIVSDDSALSGGSEIPQHTVTASQSVPTDSVLDPASSPPKAESSGSSPTQRAYIGRETDSNRASPTRIPSPVRCVHRPRTTSPVTSVLRPSIAVPVNSVHRPRTSPPTHPRPRPSRRCAGCVSST